MTEQAFASAKSGQVSQSNRASLLEQAADSSLSSLPVGLERDVFLRTLLRHLSGTLEDVVGIQEASGFISVVGQAIGGEINAAYTKALRVERLSREQVAQVCVDLKARIQGDFFVIEQDDTKIVFGNRACPFGDKVEGRPSLCMMTSNVFGTIAAENVGYGKVAIERSIARGDSGCRVVVYLEPDLEGAPGREYFKKE